MISSTFSTASCCYFLFPTSGHKMYWPGHLLPHLHIGSHSNVNLCSVFYLKAYLCCMEPFRKRLYGFCKTFLFLGNYRHHMPICAKTISSWVRNNLSMTMTYMSLNTFQGPAASAALVAGVSLVFHLPWLEFLTQLDTVFNIYHYYRLVPGSWAAFWPGSYWLVNLLVSVKHWLTASLIDMLGCQAIAVPTMKQIVPNCLCNISTRQLELLLWRARTNSPTSSSQFSQNGLIE